MVFVRFVVKILNVVATPRYPPSRPDRPPEVGGRHAKTVTTRSRSVSSLPVSEIVIGPGWQLQPGDYKRHHVVQAIQRLLDARGLHGTDIRPSRIPYDPK